MKNWSTKPSSQSTHEQIKQAQQSSVIDTGSTAAGKNRSIPVQRLEDKSPDDLE
ncbi:hypothetical protein DFP93_10398 [Aneurinibacillus soli]|uniref:Uncharacterized protein n=1 Tax=Aneurinibacillus soli TaxID=1500254 RepID=A0A0U5BDJ7_9BACL|nr:hypothetical protein [Aneurinibacillus soli]PYE62890.1 hypothetical protein DFP93_10398 [Aneurinibacillus soli]BAU29052.1 hypothetical protein CB4_03230 [Aneurinibacillus soli]